MEQTQEGDHIKRNVTCCLKMSNKTGEYFSPRVGTIWFAVLVSEFAGIFIINAFTILVFARNHRLRKRTTYLIINLTVADMLVGTVTGSLFLYGPEKGPEPVFSWRKLVILTAVNIFPVASIGNLALISLERLHATLYPFRHCLIGKWLYFKIIMGSWLIALLLASIMGALDLYKRVAFSYASACYIFLALLVITVSYVIIIVNVKSNPPLQHSVSDRKLSGTLFIVTIVSILTILPGATVDVIPVDIRNQLSYGTYFTINLIIPALYFASSIANPLIYTLRMQEFRKAVKELICGKTLESRQI